jgi:hypothetical protein
VKRVFLTLLALCVLATPAWAEFTIVADAVIRVIAWRET